ncbi:sulfurtransferase [Halarcobacter mediterraneus]|uniref:Sulfurtransferase n=1 Tax=Halarcobacter mediterraneus TaxID=2023153 RepID=A0A4Q1AV28_9BACT|nr:rhodanese-like domain-containing protein [Halarcobacter mediterraneus]RXK12732.1 sulfurtransferase [Halarcobacter mediterraneus]
MLNRSLIIILLLVVNIFAQYTNLNKNMPSIVKTTWIKKNIDNPNLVLLDLRDKEAYKKGHLLKAVNIPALKNLFDEKLFMPDIEKLQNLFSNAGIKNDSLVVAYDDGSFIWSARLYWILEILGHKNVGILNVGYKNWEEGTLPISKDDFLPNKTNFVPKVDNTKIQTKLSTLLSIGKKTIIDGRKESHYLGKESTATRFGHIPTAKNYACTQNYQVTNTGNKIKNLDELKKVYKNIPKDKEIILYCDGGAEAALNYIVLQELGYKASVYDGSWVEWGNDTQVPITNPSKLN